MKRLAILILTTSLAVVTCSMLAPTARAAELFVGDNIPFDPTTTPSGKLPVLFVHGHNPGDESVNRNYRINWLLPLNGLPSFADTLAQNTGLGIEPYYIRFSDQDHSIVADAIDIRDAVNMILERHDHSFNHNDANSTTSVKVVIIAYSKGTLSARVYLKSLMQTVPGIPSPPQSNFHPISEFIAIAPPNHGIRLGSGDTCSSRQLLNDRDALLCQPIQPVPSCSPFPDDPNGFITALNGTDEAPGSRRNTQIGSDPPVLNPPTAGVLYVTLFASGGADFVGGNSPPTINLCNNRPQASNLSPNAVNVEVSNIPGGLATTVHQNTVHTPEVICKALYAAVHHRSPAGQNCGLTSQQNNTNVIPTIPPPTRAAAMLTLDFSGSMQAPAPPDPSRAAALQAAVALFIHLWSAVSVPGDRLGVTYFDSNVNRFLPANANDQPPLLSERGEDIITNVNLQTPQGFTAMGGGLQQSIDVLDNPLLEAETRRVILFTDGMQNVDPRVQPGNPIVIATQPQTVLDTSLGISIDTIGIGAGESFVGLLRDISAGTGGRSWSTLDATDLRQFFVESLINALKGFSPQLVAYRRGSVGSGGSSSQDFTIEDGARKLVLEVSWKRGDSLDFSVAKDGVDVTGAGRFINAATHKIFVIDLPYKGITARGNWQLRINGRSGTAYETAAIIDGERISYDAMFNVQRPRAGDALDLVVRLAADGQPIRGQVKVKVAWKSPRTTVGDIIAKYKPKDPPAAEPGASAAERQILALAYDPKTWAALKPKTQTEELKSNDKGEFRKQFRPKIPGVYTAVVTIEGEDAKLGKFRRTLTATTVVGFANAKLKDRDTWVSEITSGGLRNVSITLSPSDKEGHRMGPGLSSNISLVWAGGKVSGIQDLGDGRYLVTLALKPGEDPIVSLNIAGGTVFTDKLSKLPRK